MCARKKCLTLEDIIEAGYPAIEPRKKCLTLEDVIEAGNEPSRKEGAERLWRALQRNRERLQQEKSKRI